MKREREGNALSSERKRAKLLLRERSIKGNRERDTL